MFPEIGRVKIFLSPTRPHKSNVYENICLLFLKKMQTQAKKFPLENLFVRIYVFFLWNNKKGRALCFSTKKNAVSVVFKCKLYLKNSIELIKKTFAATRVKIFFVTRLFGNKSIFVYLFIYFLPYFCLSFWVKNAT